jgi:uncharacterized membrane protein YecN with MAPEG domain
MRGKDAGTLFAVVSVLVLLSTSAEAVTGRQKRDCKADYNRYTKTGAHGWHRVARQEVLNVSRH